MKTLRFFKLFTCLGLLSINQNAYTADVNALSTEEYAIMGAHRPLKGGEKRVCDWAKHPEFTYLGVKMHKLVPAPREEKLPDGTTRLPEDGFFMEDNSFVVAALEEQGGRNVFGALKAYILEEADKPGSDIIKPHGGARK